MAQVFSGFAPTVQEKAILWPTTLLCVTCGSYVQLHFVIPGMLSTSTNVQMWHLGMKK